MGRIAELHTVRATFLIFTMIRSSM